ncbi:MAG: hypothetical protein H5U40_18080 [Polyangiaceae bacterium]|nr:hypothetical protein [Polyangiaceae bacterium]
MKRALFVLALTVVSALGCERELVQRPAPHVATEPLDALSRRLGRARQRLRERGYEETDWSMRLFLPANSGRAEIVRLDRGVCTTFLALAGGAVEELKLALYDSDGRRAAVDSVRGEASLVHACPPRGHGGPLDADVFYLKAQVRGGAGAVAIRAFQSPVGSAVGVEGIFDGILAPAADHGDEVASLLDRTLTRLRSREMLPVGRPIIARVLEGEALRRNERLEAARCYVVVARGESMVRGVALYLLDPSGAEVARDLEGRDESRIEYCAMETGEYLIEARAAEGSGDVGVSLLVDPNAAPVPAQVHPLEPVAEDGSELVHDAVSALMTRGYTSPRYVVRHAAIRPGETVAHDLVLGAGCSVLIAVPESSDMDLDLYLANREGEVTSSDRRITAEARLATCRESAQAGRAMIKAYGREGIYTLALLDAPEGASEVRRMRLLEATAPFVARGYNLAAGEGSDFQIGEREERAFPLEVPAGTPP